MAERAARVRQAVWIFVRRGIEQDARRFKCLRTKDDRLASDFLHLPRQPIYVGHAAGFVLIVVHVYVADDRVGNQLAVAGFLRVRDRRKRAAEVGKCAATAFARSAIVASKTAVVVLRHNGDATDRYGTPELRLHAIFKKNFAATHFHRWKKLAIGQHFVAFGRAADSDIFFDDVVVRREVSVRNRPVIVVAGAAGGLEVVVAQAIALAAPHERAASEDAQTLPREWFVGRRAVWIFKVVHEPLVVVLHARIALLLNRARADNFRRVVTILQLIAGHVLGELFRAHSAARFEQGYFQPGLRELFGGPDRKSVV